VSQNWTTPDGSQSGGVEVNYNTPWLFEDPLSTDDAKTFKPTAASSRGFIDPRAAQTGGLNSYLQSQTSGSNTRLPDPENQEWTGGLGLPSWAVNGITTAGKVGLGMMGAPSLITGPMGAMASAMLGDENSTAEQVQNKVGNSIINSGIGAVLGPLGSLAMTGLGAMGFDTMRGITNLNAANPPGGGTKAGFWNDAQYGTVFTGYEGSLSTADNLNRAPSTEYVSGLQTLPSGANTGNYQSSDMGGQSNSNSGWGGYSYSGPGSSAGTGGSDSE